MAKKRTSAKSSQGALNILFPPDWNCAHEEISHHGSLTILSVHLVRRPLAAIFPRLSLQKCVYSEPLCKMEVVALSGEKDRDV